MIRTAPAKPGHNSGIGDTASALTLDEQVQALDWVLKLIGQCRGNTNRDVNRAAYLAAQVLGIRYKRFCRMMKLAAIKDAAFAVADAPNEITIGQLCGYVYFAADDTGNRIKIGFSHDPATRIAVVSQITGIPLVEVHRRPGFMLNEHVYQVRARSAWLGGEWFDAEILKRLPGFEFLRRPAH